MIALCGCFKLADGHLNHCRTSSPGRTTVRAETNIRAARGGHRALLRLLLPLECRLCSGNRLVEQCQKRLPLLHRQKPQQVGLVLRQRGFHQCGGVEPCLGEPQFIDAAVIGGTVAFDEFLADEGLSVWTSVGGSMRRRRASAIWLIRG